MKTLIVLLFALVCFACMSCESHSGHIQPKAEKVVVNDGHLSYRTGQYEYKVQRLSTHTVCWIERPERFDRNDTILHVFPR